MKAAQVYFLGRIMKRFLFLSLSIIIFLSCSSSKEVVVVIDNLSEIDRQGEIVEIDITDQLSELKLERDQAYSVKDESGAIISSQITHDKKLIFRATIKAGSASKYTVSADTLRTFKPLVFGRHYPERYGDFSWENDRVGFRLYGKELKAVQAPTSGLDLWYKRTDKLVVDDWYRKELAKEASYHEDHGEGCDPYAVGQSLGGGSMAILTDSILNLNENFESFEILDNGPLRVSFRLTYPVLNINGNEIAEIRTISLDAGSQLTRIVQEYRTTDMLAVVAGFPKRMSGDSVLYKSGQNHIVYQEPMSEANGQIYLGILIPQGINDVFVNNKTRVGNTETNLTVLPNIVAATAYIPERPITYYTGFGWNKFGFNNIEMFDQYMQEYGTKLQQPLTVKIK